MGIHNFIPLISSPIRVLLCILKSSCILILRGINSVNKPVKLLPVFWILLMLTYLKTLITEAEFYAHLYSIDLWSNSGASLLFFAGNEWCEQSVILRPLFWILLVITYLNTLITETEFMHTFKILKLYTKKRLEASQ